MTIEEAAKLLEHYNKWRKGADVKMINPKVLGEAIEIAVKELEKLSE